MNFKKIFTLCFIFLGLFASGQKISHIKYEFINNNIEISYQLSSLNPNRSYEVSLFVSTDGGETFNGPMKMVTGDVGKDISKGNKKITWSVFDEYKSLEGDVIFNIKAEVIKIKVEREFFVQYSAGFLLSSIDYKTPFGLMVGQLGKTGWYCAARFNTFETAPYSYTNNEVSAPILYEFNEKKLFPRMTITAGITYELNKNVFAYAGAGYATKKYYTNLTELSKDDLSELGDKWVSMQDEVGAEIEVGGIINFNKISCSMGISTFNFNQVGLNLGVGYKF